LLAQCFTVRVLFMKLFISFGKLSSLVEMG
jgi:hypothetical protein